VLLEVHRAHSRRVIALAGGGGDGVGDPLHLLRAQLDLSGGEVLLEICDALGAGDGNDVPPAVEHPGKRELTRRDAPLGGELLHALGELAVVLEVLAGEAGAVAAEVPLVELLGRAEAPREEAAAKRRVGDEGDAELLQGGQHIGLQVAGPQRVLALHGRDGVHRVGAADRLRGGLREADVAHLAGRDQLRHRADGLLDRRVGVDTVLVVEVDVLHPEALQRGLTGSAHVGGTAVDRAPRRILVELELDAELGRQEHLLTTAGDGASDEPLVGVGAVHVGGVEEVAAEIERPSDRAGGLPLVGRPVEG
jgi:hypothetical protein